MITLCTASGGGSVTDSSTGRPMFSPPPLMPESAPTPTIVVSELTSYMPAGRVIIPSTTTVRGPSAAMASMNDAASETGICGPPAPPVVPSWPSADTLANPVGVSASTDGGTAGAAAGAAWLAAGPRPKTVTAAAETAVALVRSFMAPPGKGVVGVGSCGGQGGAGGQATRPTPAPAGTISGRRCGSSRV